MKLCLFVLPVWLFGCSSDESGGGAETAVAQPSVQPAPSVTSTPSVGDPVPTATEPVVEPPAQGPAGPTPTVVSPVATMPAVPAPSPTTDEPEEPGEVEPPVSEGPAKVLSYSLIGERRIIEAPNCSADGTSCDYAYSDTRLGYVHDSIPAGDALLKELAVELGFELTVYEGDERDDVVQEFTFDNLSEYRAIVFNNPNGLGLNAEQREAFKQYMQAGGGYVGIHAGANCEKDWSWFHDLLGAFETGVVGSRDETLEAASDFSTDHLPAEWTFYDEWHEHSRWADTQPGISVLLRRQGQPVAWYQEFEGGRMWYTGLGHFSETFEDDNFRQHLAGGIQWAAQLEGAAP